MNRTIMSYSSAVVAVARWIQAHDGRIPCGRDYTQANGLPHRVTLQYVCGGPAHAVSAALVALQGLPMSGAESATYNQYMSALYAQTLRDRTQMCLRCGTTMLWQGKHVRQCEKCRSIAGEWYEDWQGATRVHIPGWLDDDER